MSSRKQWVPKGTYDNRITGRRETYDHKGNVIVSEGPLYANAHPAHYGKFGKLPDVPTCPIDWKDKEDE